MNTGCLLETERKKCRRRTGRENRGRGVGAERERERERGMKEEKERCICGLGGEGQNTCSYTSIHVLYCRTW